MKHKKLKKTYIDTLTPAELRVSDLLIDGCSNDEIAQIIGITEKTVKFHLTSIFKKANVECRLKYVVGFYKKHWVKKNEQL